MTRPHHTWKSCTLRVSIARCPATPMPVINAPLVPTLPVGSPPRSLSARQQSPRTLLRHRQSAATSHDTQCKAWIVDTLHQLHRHTVPRAALFSSGRQPELCKICSTPLSGTPAQRGSNTPLSSAHRPLRGKIQCRSVAAELQSEASGGGPRPPGGSDGNGGGGDGGSHESHHHIAKESPLPERHSAQHLEDIILFDVQGGSEPRAKSHDKTPDIL